MVYLVELADLVLEAYVWVIVARAVVSWVSPDPFNPIVRFLYRATEPVLRPVRQLMPTTSMGLDLSPMVVILGIYILKRFVLRALYGIAQGLG